MCHTEATLHTEASEPVGDNSRNERERFGGGGASKTKDTRCKMGQTWYRKRVITTNPTEREEVWSRAEPSPAPRRRSTPPAVAFIPHTLPTASLQTNDVIQQALAL